MPDHTSFIERVERLLALMEAERESPEIVADRDYVVAQLRAMIANAASGALPPRESRHPLLAYMAADHWPLGHPLANEVGEVETLYRRL